MKSRDLIRQRTRRPGHTGCRPNQLQIRAAESLADDVVEPHGDVIFLGDAVPHAVGSPKTHPRG